MLPELLATSVDTAPLAAIHAMKNGGFTLRRVRVKAQIADGNGGHRPASYHTWQIRGYLAGRRVRKQIADEHQAQGELNRLRVQAANAEGQLHPVNTRLTPDQLVAAEAAFHRLGAVPLSAAVDWYLATYRPPVASMALEKAAVAFLADRLPHISKPYAREYRRELRWLCATFPGHDVHAVKTAELRSRMEARQLGRKGWNNLRGLLHAFFAFCRGEPRRWCLDNPVQHLPKYALARGIPEIASAAKIAELFAYLESFAGGPRKRCKPGCLVPYFALCTFAGIRPAVPHGEAWKLGKLASLDRVIDLQNGVIRIGPAVAKTKDLRQITIQPNLRAWLERYPLKKYPIVIPNLQALVTDVRKKFELSHDVLRHTFISMHVAKFKSLGSTALEAGNSERIIKKHYLNSVTEAEAEAFWAICPARLESAVCDSAKR